MPTDNFIGEDIPTQRLSRSANRPVIALSALLVASLFTNITQFTMRATDPNRGRAPVAELHAEEAEVAVADEPVATGLPPASGRAVPASERGLAGLTAGARPGASPAGGAVAPGASAGVGANVPATPGVNPGAASGAVLAAGAPVALGAGSAALAPNGAASGAVLGQAGVTGNGGSVDNSRLGGSAAGLGEGTTYTLRVSIQNNISSALSVAEGVNGSALAQEVARLLVWDFNPQSDLRPGDSLEVAYFVTPSGDMEVLAARLHSQKLARNIEAYRYQADGDAYATWWTADGVEVPRTLKNAPIRSYEQITSLIGDGRGHDGMDFKAPVGTEVYAPFDAVVTRINWNSRFNGTCAELRYPDGVHAYYLHLDSVDVAVGARVSAGQKVGTVGNTGRSFAAHLHYQLMRGSTVLDPLKYHDTNQRRIPAADAAELSETVTSLRAMLDQANAK